MKVRDLIDVLNKYPPDADVLITWENTVHPFDAEDVYVCRRDPSEGIDYLMKCPVGTVLLDGDGSHYKTNYDGESLA